MPSKISGGSNVPGAIFSEAAFAAGENENSEEVSWTYREMKWSIAAAVCVENRVPAINPICNKKQSESLT
jgi:hypothetical protein